MLLRNPWMPALRTRGWLRKGLFVAALALFGAAQAQLNFDLAYFNSAYSPITQGGGASVAGATGDGIYTNGLPIGFTFNYDGANYTTFGVSTDGYISFTATVNSLTNTNLFSTTAPNAVLAPWWDDLNTNAVGTNPAGSILYQTIGSPGAQVLVVQWINSSFWSTGSGQPKLINFQVRLYESTNVIEFHYGDAIGSTINSGESASVGINSATGGDNNFICAITGSKRVGNAAMTSAKWPDFNIRFTPAITTPMAGGTYTVGTGGDYSNLNLALRDLNLRGVSGAVTLDLTDAAYDTTAAGGRHIFPLVIGPIAGSSPTNTVTVTSSVNSTISFLGTASGNISTAASTTGISNASEPLIAMVGCNNVTVENLNLVGGSGINPPRNVDRGITMRNVTATQGAQNNTVQNVSITLDRTNTNTIGIQQVTAPGATAATGANSNNTYRDLTIRNTNKGINLFGTSATWPDVGCSITTSNCGTRNSIGDPNVAGDIGNTATIPYGIQLQNQSGFTVENTDIRNVLNTGGQADGINILGYLGTCTVRNNTISGVRNGGAVSTTFVAGLRATHATTGANILRVFNNAISGVTSGYTGTVTSTRVSRGIFIAGTGGTSAQAYEVWNNTVSMDGTANPNASNVCFETASATGPEYTVANNIFANYTSGQTGVARHLGMYSPSPTVWGTGASSVRNNAIHIQNDAGVTGFTALGSSSPYDGAAAMEAAMAQATDNLDDDPVLVDAVSNLRSSAAALNDAGDTAPAYVDNDLDCAPRQADIGAYNINACDEVVAGAIGGAATACQGDDVDLELQGATFALGISYQWAYSTTQGGPYTNLLGDGLTQSTSSLSAVGTYYIVVDVTCSDGPTTETTAEFTFTREQTPTAEASSNAPICIGDDLELTGASDVGVTFLWSGPDGFSSSDANPTIVDAGVANSGLYSFTATLGGCSATGTVNAQVFLPPVIQSITAEPNPVCIGADAQLEVNAIKPNVLISEVTVFRTGTGQTPAYPAYVTPAINDFIELNNASDSPADISGWTIGDYASNVANSTRPFTFPAGTVIPPNGTVVIGMGTGANDPANLYFCLGGGNDVWFSTSVMGVLLKDDSGDVVDVVAGGPSFIWNPATGVTPEDWTNTTLSFASGSAGIIRVGADDTNSGADWVAANIPSPLQSIGTFNGGYNNPAPAPTGYSWAPTTFLDDPTIANPMAEGVTETTVYTVTVTGPGGCTAQGEITLNATDPITAASISGDLGYCVGGDTELTAVPADGGGPFTYLWSPGGETSASITVDAEGDYSCQVTDACGGSVNTGIVSVVENPLPTVEVAPTSEDYCANAPAVVLTASGADTYSWAPATGLNTTSGAVVEASPVATTVYTVTGTDANGCENTATATVTVLGNAPVILSASATPGTLCAGENAQLNVNAQAAGIYEVTPIPYNLISGTPSNIVNWGNGGSNNADDGFSPATPLPFPFIFDGQVVTQLWVGSNGYVTFNNPATVTGLECRTALNMNAATNPNGVIALAFADLNVTGGATIGTFVSGTPGSQVFVINFSAVPFFSNTGSVNGQIQLYEGSNRIEVHVTNVDPGTSFSNRALGIENIAGSDRVFPAGRAPGTWTVVTPEAWSFIPPVVTYDWSPATYLTSTTIANPEAIGVMTSETYTVTVTAGNGCTNVAVVEVNIDETDTDGDGTTDCDDDCPNDPDKTEPGACGCGVPDTDTDGDGTPDCIDECPNDPDKTEPGQCGCGVPDSDTDGDGIADCIDSCPLLPGQEGDPCDDEDPNTVGDAIVNCECVGTPIGACLENGLFLTITTDANGAQTSWEIRNDANNQVECSGAGLPNNSTVTSECCLPDGCYRLRVFDSFGDGINPGGYVLRQGAVDRIIDNTNNGSTFGSLSAADNAFCLPIGNDQVAAATCDNLALAPNGAIVAVANPAVTAQFGITNATSGYQYWVFNPHGGYSRRIFQAHNTGVGPAGALRCTQFRINSLATDPIPQNTLLNVRIRSRVAGVYAEFGPACRMRVGAPTCSTTQLVDTPGPIFSCGVVKTFGGNDQISAFVVNTANRYQFRFERVGGGFARNIASNDQNLTLAWSTSPLVDGDTYDVRVRVSFDGGSTYCPYGPVCQVTINNNAPEAGRAVEAGEEVIEMSIFPNPNRDGLVTVRLNGTPDGVEKMLLEVTDMFGKLVHAEHVPTGNLHNHVMDLGKLSGGMYLVTLTTPEERWIQRLVIAR